MMDEMIHQQKED